MSILRIYTLGTPRVKVDDSEIHLPRKKSLALICYLALQKDAAPRQTLARLLWDTPRQVPAPPNQQGRDTALGNLRRALHDLTHTTGTQWFEINRANVRLQPENTWVDVLEFSELADIKVFPSTQEPAPARSDTSIRNWQKAVKLYTGPFLEGLHVRARNFNLWKGEQERNWEERLLLVLRNLAQALFARQEYEQALAYTTRWLQTNESDDNAHLLIMRIYAATGQRFKAMQQYRAYQQVLEEYGVPPNSDIQNLYRQITGQDDSALAPSPHPPVPFRQKTTQASRYLKGASHFPVYFSPFVGREADISAIIARLQTPECRLLTVVAPGGTGKTRLAVRVGEMVQEDYPDGIFFVDLSRFAPKTHLYEALQSALLPEPPRSDVSGNSAADNLVHALDGKSVLLILDNFEHLTAQATYLPYLLSVLPSLTILVTSRERLNLHGEWTYPLEGLSYPDKGETPSSLIPLCKQYSAVQLFVNRARQNAAYFQITDQNREQVVRICRLTKGSPLAIEMCAAWIPQFPCQVIADKLSNRLDILQSHDVDIPPRQRTYRASCDYSWDLLTPHHQEILCKLSVFRDVFDYKAVREIANVQLKDLRALADKSWIHPTSPGQYHLHALLRQYIQEKVARHPQLQRATAKKHAGYYARYLNETSKNFLGLGQKTALERCNEDRENIHAAWEWAIEHKAYPLLELMCAPLFTFYRLKNLFRIGKQRYEQAIESLRDQEGKHITGLRNHLQNRYAWFVYILGEYRKAETIWQEGLAVAQQMGDVAEEAFCLSNLGLTAQVVGQWEDAYEKIRRSLEKYRQLGNAHEVANCQKRLGYILTLQEKHAEAEKFYRRCLRIYEDTGDQYNIALVNAFLSDCAYVQGHTAQARLLAQHALEIANRIDNKRLRALALNRLAPTLPPHEAIKVHRTIAMLLESLGDRIRTGIAYNNLGGELIEMKEYPEAESVYYLALQAFDESQDKRGKFFTTFNLGRLHILWQNPEIARRHMTDALMQATQMESARELELYALSGFALYFQAFGDWERALCLAATVLQHPQAGNDARKFAENVLKEASQALGAENVSRQVVPIPPAQYEALKNALLSIGTCSPPDAPLSETSPAHLAGTA